MELVHTTAFQRLRRVRQVGFAYLTYHGAEHSRFSHSLGVAHVARRMVRTIQAQGHFCSDEDRLEVLCAALLHDIGHGPFSHAIEGVTGVHHEQYTSQLIEDPDSPVYQVLTRLASDLPARVAAYFGPIEDFPTERRALRDIVTSQLDADRQDYILRDGVATGMQLGAYDFERIQAMFEVFEEPTDDGGVLRRLATNYRAREAVEGYLIARFHMYKQVYTHRVVRVAEKMLKLVFTRAVELLGNGYAFRTPPGPMITRLLSGEALSTREFLDLDDANVWGWLKGWRHEDDLILSELAAGLLDRRLYKTVELGEGEDMDEVVSRAHEAAQAAGLDPLYTIIPDHIRVTLYKPFNPHDTSASPPIPIVNRHGQIEPIEERSDLLKMLAHGVYEQRRVCMPRALRLAAV